MEQYRPEILISEEEIALRIRALGQAITRDFEHSELAVCCVLRGAFIFCADLCKKIDLPVTIDFISLSSYEGGMETTGKVKLTMDIASSVEDRHVLIVEDIVDTGLTYQFLIDHFKTKKPRSINFASLLYKPARTLVEDVKIDYMGFEIEDKFVVGYGLDYNNRYRELPYIGVLNAGN